MVLNAEKINFEYCAQARFYILASISATVGISIILLA